MSKGYWLAIYRAIHDQDQLAEYAKKATVAIAEHGGTFLSRGMPMKGSAPPCILVTCRIMISASPAWPTWSRRTAPNWQASRHGAGLFL